MPAPRQDLSDRDWYYCLDHHRVERGPGCPADRRLGPYASEAEARDWRARHEQREKRWEREDERWEGRGRD